MKTLLTLLMLIGGTCLAVTIINPYRFGGPGTPTVPAVPTEAETKQIQTEKGLVDGRTTVEFQSYLNFYNTIATTNTGTQFQVGLSYINRASSATYQTMNGYQN